MSWVPRGAWYIERNLPVVSAVGEDAATGLEKREGRRTWLPSLVGKYTSEPGSLLLRLTVHAHPNARQERVSLRPDGVLEIWVRAPAVEGKANAAIERAVADALALRPRQVSLVRGTTGRQKTLEVDLPDLAAVQARLLARGVRTQPPGSA